MDRRIKIFSPATVGNIGPGFDILGLALEGIGEEIEMSLTDDGAITIEMPGTDVPTNPDRNVAGVALKAMLAELKSEQGFHLIIRKKIKVGSGLGTSASSAAGAVFAANALLGALFTKMELLNFATVGESMASSMQHADNVAPCMLGGITLVRGYDPLDVVALSYPSTLRLAIIHPQIEIKTSYAKEILPKEIPMGLAIKQWGNIAGLVAGLASDNSGLISRSLEDVIVEPVRAALIPGFAALKAAAIKNGAMGCSISGSGPSVFALCENEDIATKVSEAFSKVYSKLEIPFSTYQSGINKEGVKIIDL